MIVARTIAHLREAITDMHQHIGGQPSVGFVPTMGALHDGHISLVQAAQRDNDIVVLSAFVNPTQFNDPQDFEHYPRTEAQDIELAEHSGVNIFFAPTVTEMYPEGFSTTVRVSGRIAEVLEAEHRGASHFEGMATIVTKLLNAVAPDKAYFGEKDYQQLLIVKRLVQDLGMPIAIIGCPTLREADGLARSSRNTRLSALEREQASAVPRTMRQVRLAFEQGETSAQTLTELATEELSQSGITVDYLAFINATTLESVQAVTGETLFALAVHVGDIRLIDNQLLGADA